MPDPSSTEYMNVAEAARVLGAAEATIRTAIREGRIVSTTVYGRVVISAAAIDEYRRRTRPDGEKPRGRPRKLNAST
jgi:excisionase family DNA binding protein